MEGRKREREQGDHNQEDEHNRETKKSKPLGSTPHTTTPQGALEMVATLPTHLQRVAQTTMARVITLVLEHRMFLLGQGVPGDDKDKDKDNKGEDKGEGEGEKSLRRARERARGVRMARAEADAALLRHYLGALVWDEKALPVVLSAVLAGLSSPGNLVTSSTSASTSSAVAASITNAEFGDCVSTLSARTSVSLGESYAKNGKPEPPLASSSSSSLASSSAASSSSSTVPLEDPVYVLVLVELIRLCAKKVTLLAQPIVRVLQKVTDAAGAQGKRWIAPEEEEEEDALLRALTLTGLCAQRVVHDAVLLAPRLLAMNSLVSDETPPVILYQIEGSATGAPASANPYEDWRALYSRLGPVVSFTTSGLGDGPESEAELGSFLDALLLSVQNVFSGPVVLVTRRKTAAPMARALSTACAASGSALCVSALVAISVPAGPQADLDALASLAASGTPVLVLQGGAVLSSLYPIEKLAAAAAPNGTRSPSSPQSVFRVKIVADADAELSRSASFLARHSLSRSTARLRVLMAIQEFLADTAVRVPRVYPPGTRPAPTQVAKLLASKKTPKKSAKGGKGGKAAKRKRDGKVGKGKKSSKSGGRKVGGGTSTASASASSASAASTNTASASAASASAATANNATASAE